MEYWGQVLGVEYGGQLPGVESWGRVLGVTYWGWVPGVAAVKAPREIHVSEVTENSARLHWERPEPPSPYVYNLTVTSAHDQAVVLKQNLTVTARVVGGLLPGQTYHVTVTCSLRSQVRAVYQGSFSTSKCKVTLRTVSTPLCTGYQTGRPREQFRSTGPCPEKQQQGYSEILHILVVPNLIN